MTDMQPAIDTNCSRKVRKKAPPTSRQLLVLAKIHSVSANGFPPTIREIGDMLGLSSTFAVWQHLVALERKGLIERSDGKQRRIRITGEGIAALGVLDERVLLRELVKAWRVAEDETESLVLRRMARARLFELFESVNRITETSTEVGGCKL